jgi:serine/threonine protein kinase
VPIDIFDGTERFEIIRRLGTGGMGAVYEAFDRERQLPVALKLLNLRHPEALMRFKNEFRALQAVHHPNLVSLGELFQRGEQWFFTMELVRGVDLVTHIRTDGGDARLRFDTPRLRAAFHQLALGLAALHRHGHIHRDLKPSNVMVARDNRVVLLDFGLVREPGKSLDTSPDVVVGTPEYMSPEQAMGESLGPSSDWYSLGVILYEALVGAPPFTGTPMQVMMQKTRSDPPAPQLRAPDLPADLSSLCMALMRRDPAQRPTETQTLERLYVELRRDDRTWLTLPLHPSSECFVGRKGPLAELEGAFDAGAAAVPLVFVTGAWGIGKTALVRELAQRLATHTRAPLTWSSRCHERESIPFKAVDMLIDDAVRFLLSLPPAQLPSLLPPDIELLARTFPGLMRVPAIAERPPGAYGKLEPEGRRRLLFAAARALVHGIAQLRPLVLIVEDLQWGDADGLALLNHLLATPLDTPLLFVGTLRTEQPFALAPAVLVDGLAPSRLSFIHLDPLSPAEMMELVRFLLPGVDERSLRRIVTQAAGHPLFAHELCLTKDVHALRLGDALRARIEPLEPAARAVLDVLAVAEVALPQSLVGDIARLPWSEAERAITHLRAAQLARTVGLRRTDLVEVAHDRVRDAVRAALLGPSLRQIHERIATALSEQPRASVESLAAHWLGAGRPAQALSCLVAGAAEAAQALAFERAISLYNRALTLCDDDAGRAAIAARARALTAAARR